MKRHLFSLALSASVALSQATFAGEPVMTDKNVSQPEPAPYEGGRGLVTVQGPTGMFINPTSATIPQGAYTLQYCMLLPRIDGADLIAHNVFASFGVTDWLEIGGIGKFLDDRNAGDVNSTGGPVVRIRLLKDEGAMPQLSIGGYAVFGDSENYNAFAALYKRVEISKDGFVRSIGFNAGIREEWVRKPGSGSNTPVGYFGAEVQFPLRVYLVGEVSTEDKNSGGDKTPYAFGLQWRLGGINLSAAFLNFGALDKPSFFWGIGSQIKF